MTVYLWTSGLWTCVIDWWSMTFVHKPLFKKGHWPRSMTKKRSLTGCILYGVKLNAHWLQRLPKLFSPSDCLLGGFVSKKLGWSYQIQVGLIYKGCKYWINKWPSYFITRSHYKTLGTSCLAFVPKQWELWLSEEKLQTILHKLYETQIEGIWGYDDTDMLPESYPHRKYMICMVWNII